MLLRISPDAEEAIYVQIRNQIVEGIAKGELEYGEKLPSVRSLAADIGVNFHTVNKAYQLLEREGFILIHNKKGVTVRPEGIEKADGAYFEKLHQSLRTLISEAAARSVPRDVFLKDCESIYSEIEQEQERSAK
ncbi:hypothetical protein MFLO_12771 [Listeria floridensis FSL S10-1187]|uniref:HTH gntR-type domain-containing protein n=1 Tax=Listeria floridensis FSL S10-1187 TaxID=1265817 RepID=A0ABN0RD53_9LIST|nr:GntR family transcriptional regulator [Listeria floridensis]EUJ28035.1 hypothetical protein MFLO_12771 [Listeria floridensis FSL S10-1187]